MKLTGKNPWFDSMMYVLESEKPLSFKDSWKFVLAAVRVLEKEGKLLSLECEGEYAHEMDFSDDGNYSLRNSKELESAMGKILDSKDDSADIAVLVDGKRVRVMVQIGDDGLEVSVSGSGDGGKSAAKVAKMLKSMV